MKTFCKILLALVVVSLVAAAFFGQGSIKMSKNRQESKLCKNCHEMNPNVYTWQVSSHNKVGCLRCHSDISLTNFTYKHLVGWVEEPVVKTGFMPNETCQSCHSTNTRKVSPRPGIIFPHNLHLIKGIDCVDCHSTVTHFGVARQIMDGKLASGESFTAAQGVQAGQKGNAMTMKDCLRCHNGAKATSRCGGCHVVVPT
ncbi:MAG: cytochrome c3 family protein [Thermincolia bacterium]